MTIGLTGRQKLLDDVFLMMGGGLVTRELTPQHYQLALDLALDRYRQRSSNAVEDSVGFLELQPEQDEYILPQEVMAVQQIFRRGSGGQTTGGGSSLDPFALAYNNLYLLQASGQGGLTTFDLFAEYQETVGRMFGANLDYSYNPTSKKLRVVRRILTPETVALRLFNYRPEETLFQDQFARPWIRDWTEAYCQKMLGEAYSKFAQIAGPQGGSTLNGADLIARAQATFDRLEMEVKTQVDGQDSGYTWIIG